MPANLTPQYRKVEAEYRRAASAQERADCLQQMLRLIPKHKGTEKLQAELKARLKDCKSDIQTEKQSPKKGVSYKFPRQGAGRVVIVGGPNSGKSRLLVELTNANATVAEYPFATREPLPGMMNCEDVAVQLIDTPPITETHIDSYLTSLVRTADTVALCMNGASDDGPQEAADVVGQFRQRKTILGHQTGFGEDDLSTLQLKTVLVVTRGNDSECRERIELFYELVDGQFEEQVVELSRGNSVEAIRDEFYQSLNVIRVYTKPPGKPADYSSPFTIPIDGTPYDLAVQVHRDLADSLKFSKVWGSSAHDGQRVGNDHRLRDGDIVELHC